MDRQEILQTIKQKFSDDILSVLEKAPDRIFMEIKAEAIGRMAKSIFKDMGARFNIASGVDSREHMEILYHFTFEDARMILSLRVKLDKAKLEI